MQTTFGRKVRKQLKRRGWTRSAVLDLIALTGEEEVVFNLVTLSKEEREEEASSL